MNNFGTYLQGIGNRLGITRESTPTRFTRPVSFFKIQNVHCHRGIQVVCALIGFEDGGYSVWTLSDNEWKLVSTSSSEECQSLGAVAVMCLLSPLPGSTSPSLRNLALVRHSTCIVEFLDFSNEKIYHQIKTPNNVVGILANEFVVAVCQSGGTISLHSATSLEEIRSISASSTLFSLGDRWLAYQTTQPDKKTASSVNGSSSSFVNTAINTVSAISQDAFDNIVKAIGGEEVSRETFLGSSPIATRKNSILGKEGYVGVVDVVTGDTVSVFEVTQNEISRPVELIQFSACGMKIFVSVGNGHYVDVYKVGRGNCDTNSVITFNLEKRLNRGVTPAKISSVTSTHSLTAVFSSNGTVHLFNEAGDTVGRIKAPDSESQVLLLNKGCDKDVLVVLGKNGTVEMVQVGPSMVSEDKSEKFDLASSHDTPVCVVEIPNPSNHDEIPLFNTCDPLPVPYWKSPMLSWPGGNYRDKLTAELVTCAHIPDREQILEALGTDMFAPERAALARDRYEEQMGKEGFVQILESS